MIVRIATEGQYRIDSVYLDQLNEIDNKLVEVIGSGDRKRFQTLLNDLLSLVREHGTLLPDDELVSSDVVLPAPDTTFDEAADLFKHDGVIIG